MLQLMWFRNDLRVKDNSALSAAMLAGPTLALFVVTPEQWRRHDEAACKIDFWMRNLAALKAELQILGVPLLIRHAQTWDDIPAVLADSCQRGVWNQRRPQGYSGRRAADGKWNRLHSSRRSGIVCAWQHPQPLRRVFPGLLPVPQGLLAKTAQQSAALYRQTETSTATGRTER